MRASNTSSQTCTALSPQAWGPRGRGATPQQKRSHVPLEEGNVVWGPCTPKMTPLTAEEMRVCSLGAPCTRRSVLPYPGHGQAWALGSATSATCTVQNGDGEIRGKITRAPQALGPPGPSQSSGGMRRAEYTITRLSSCRRPAEGKRGECGQRRSRALTHGNWTGSPGWG